MKYTYMDAMTIYTGSNGDATKSLYAALADLGPQGLIAMNLFRAHKTSARAKVYRGGNGRGSYRAQSYETKAWSLNNLATVLDQHGMDLGIVWGWAEDPDSPIHKWVLYVEIPTGQVSFHTGERGKGPGYNRPWDGVRRQGSNRICSWIGRLFNAQAQKERPGTIGRREGDRSGPGEEGKAAPAEGARCDRP